MGLLGRIIGLAVTVAGAATVASKLAKKKEEKEKQQAKITRLENELNKTHEAERLKEKEIQSLQNALKTKEQTELNQRTKCKNCGTQNLPNASFCNICGQELFIHKKIVTKYCPSCGCKISGLEGQIVECKYCDSKFTI